MPSAVPLSVIMPAYNERQAIVPAVADVQRHVLDRVAGAELIVVNDGSRDDTGRVLDDTAATDSRVRVIHQENRGHGGALMTGLSAARGDYVFLIDSDRQIPLDDFSSAWAEVAAGREAVFGVRRRRHDPPIRLYLSGVIRRTVELMFGVRLLDANVPYKVLRRAIWEDAQKHIPPGTLAPSLFLAIVTKRRGYDVVELDVMHKARGTGEVSIRRLKLLKFCAAGLSQMLQLRRQLNGTGRDHVR